MLKRYKNSLLKLIQDNGVDITRLRGTEATVEGYPAFVIQYGETPLQFITRYNPADPHSFDYAFTRLGVPAPQKFSFLPSARWSSFDEVSLKFSTWVTNEVRSAVDEELSPDLWSLMADGQISIGSNNITPFTSDERHQTKLALDTFKLLINKEFEPTQDQRAIVVEQLDYLADAVDRLNTFDWRGVAISTLMSISIALGLDTERGRTLYALFQQAFTSIMHLLK